MPKEPLPETTFTRSHAEAGNANAQFGLGIFSAATAPEDYAQALFWYQKAADQDHALAQFNLGQMYALGHGMPKNDAMALMWIRRAAAGGDAGAQFELGRRYARSSVHGTEMDAVESRIEAFKWFSLAAAQEYRNAGVQCDSAAMRMSRDEITEGNRRIRVVQRTENKS